MISANNKMKNTAETQLQVAIAVLLDSVADKSPSVCNSVTNSLTKLSEKHPNQLLQSSSKYCTKIPPPNPEQLGPILQLMSKICSDHLENIDGDTVVQTIEFSLKLMTKNPNYEPAIQMPASEVLVALSRIHYVLVLDALRQNLQAGVVPHYTIPHTMGSLASTNPYSVVAYLKDILHIMLPLLGGLRTDHLKQAFSFALQNFCEALVEYVSNPEQVADPTITTETFKTELSMAYDVLFSAWLQSKEPKVVETVLEALGAIFVALPIDKVTQQIPKIIPLLISFYKKNVNPYVVTKCLYAVLTKGATVNGMLLEPLLSNILNNLSELICLNPDYAQPDSARCHSEVLRCYECIAVYFTDTTIDKLLGHLRNNNDRDKLKGLIVITHLITFSAEQTIHRRLKDILKHVQEMLQNSHIKIRKVLVKIIIALAHKKVLINQELNPDGAEVYLEFILKMSCIRQLLPKNSEISLEELKDIQTSADNALYVLTTSVPELEAILWNLLLKCLLSTKYDEAIVIILRCLTYLASKKPQTENSEAAFVRCMVLLSNPLPSLRGTFLLNFLRNISPCSGSGYKSVWEVKLPHLSKYLDQNFEGFNVAEWHDLMFDFLNLLLENVGNEGFNEILLADAHRLLGLYNNMRNSPNIDKEETKTKFSEKRFLMKFIAVILCYLKSKESVLQTLDILLVNVRLTDYSELHACAEAVGVVSRLHLDLVLEKLAQIRREILTKKSSKLFSFVKNQTHESGLERYVIIYSYAEVCNQAPSDQLLRVVESEILEFVLSELLISKEFAIKRVCLKAINSVADAMHPNRNKLHIKMNERDKVIEAVFNQMHLHNGPEYIELFPIIIPAMTALIKLPLPLESPERIRLMKLFFDNIYNASAIYCKISPNHTNNNYYGDLKLVPSVTKSFSELNQFVQELLLQNLSPATLDEICGLLETWLAKKKQEQRLPAIETLRLVLQCYLDNMRFAHDLPTNFGQTGLLLARIVPRCTDPNKNIRKVAVDCVCLILCIAARYDGHMRDHDKLLAKSLQNVQQNIESDDPKLLFNLTSDLAQIVCQNLPQFQLIHFVDGLIDALLDCEASSSNGTSVILNISLKNKGNELQNHVQRVTERILGQLDKIQCPRTKSSTLRAVLSLASHHSRIVGGILLMQPLPFESSICDCWSVLSSDKTLVQDLIDQIKKLIKTTPLYELQSTTDIKVATLPPLQAICALHELLKNTQLQEICLEHFPELFSLLLISLASYIDCQAPAMKISNEKNNKYGFILNRDAYRINPAKVAFDTFRLFLICSNLTNMGTNLLGYNSLEGNLFLEIVDTLVNNICLEKPESLSWIVACLGPFIRSELEPQKVAVVAFFAYLLKQGTQNGQTVLIENLLEMILDVQMDQSCSVRQIGLEGLGYAAENLHRDLVSRYSNQILGVLMNSLDYQNIGSESEVILESLRTFSKLLNALEGYKFHSFQVTAAVRVKLLFSQEDDKLRRAAFRLLGDLTASLGPETNLDAFREQIQGNLVTLLLHLCDPDIYVVKACKYTLRKVGPYLESPEVNTMIQEHLIDDANLHFADFVKDFIKIMAKDRQDLFVRFVMTGVSYLKSPWVSIRSNGALVTGLLYSELAAENKDKVSLDAVCDKLMRLMQDDSEEVRVKASQAMAYLFI